MADFLLGGQVDPAQHQRTDKNTVVASGDTYGLSALQLSPTPADAVPLSVYYEASPRPLWTEFESGAARLRRDRKSTRLNSSHT